MGFWSRKSKEKLYKQWTEYSDLPPEAIPEKRATPKKEEDEEAPVRRGGGGQRLLLLYILLGVAIAILCAGIVILLTKVI